MYRILSAGAIVEADSVEAVVAFLAAVAPVTTTPLKPKATAARPARQMRGASSGSLEGRILDVLRAGPMSPADVVASVKCERSSVVKAAHRLQASGKLVASGATLKRRWSLK